jgi:hypothetical protein
MNLARLRQLFAAAGYSRSSGARTTPRVSTCCRAACQLRCTSRRGSGQAPMLLERSFAWPGRSRTLAKNFERLASL